MTPRRCPLCAHAVTPPHASHTRGTFHRCARCSLVFLDPARWPSRAEERVRYGHHENALDDAGYQAHLSVLADAVIARTSAGASGIDYGSGAVPALALLLSRSGRPTESYDPMFRTDAAVLARQYDFVTCSEVIEHVHEPRALVDRLVGLARPGGILAIMTGMADLVQSFAEWWYVRDVTHVCFYSRPTMEWIARSVGCAVEFPVPNVSIMRLR